MEQLMSRFQKLANALSPENLCCDGEISNAQAMKKQRAIMKDWKALEAIAGRKVTEDEVWSWYVWTLDHPYEAERARNKELNREVEIRIKTFVPSKWRFQDLETGEVWRWDGEFKKAEK